MGPSHPSLVAGRTKLSFAGSSQKPGLWRLGDEENNEAAAEGNCQIRRQEQEQGRQAAKGEPCCSPQSFARSFVRSFSVLQIDRSREKRPGCLRRGRPVIILLLHCIGALQNSKRIPYCSCQVITKFYKDANHVIDGECLVWALHWYSGIEFLGSRENVSVPLFRPAGEGASERRSGRRARREKRAK